MFYVQFQEKEIKIGNLNYWNVDHRSLLFSGRGKSKIQR